MGPRLLEPGAVFSTARVLLLITPAGLEEFFQEMGVPIKEELALLEHFTSENLERMVTTASKYGVETKLP